MCRFVPLDVLGNEGHRRSVIEEAIGTRACICGTKLRAEYPLHVMESLKSGERLLTHDDPSCIAQATKEGYRPLPNGERIVALKQMLNLPRRVRLKPPNKPSRITQSSRRSPATVYH